MKQFNFEDVKIDDRLIADNGEVLTYIGFSNDIPFENKKFYCRRDRTLIKGFCAQHKYEDFDYKGRIIEPPQKNKYFPPIYKINGKFDNDINLKYCYYGDKLRLKSGEIALFLGESFKSDHKRKLYNIVVRIDGSILVYTVDDVGKTIEDKFITFEPDVVEILK